MPVQHYCLFKGWAVERQLATFNNPHYQIHAIDQIDDYRISVNVFSDILFGRNNTISEVEYFLAEDFNHPITARLERLEPGLYPLDKFCNRHPGGLALDYVRTNLLDPAKMKTAPFNLPGSDLTNELNENLENCIKGTLLDKSAMIYAFGSQWGSQRQPDKIFGFRPAKGLSNIHMNQGNTPDMFEEDNGIWQDGALLIYRGTEKKWTGFFLKFKQQSWDTWDDTGAPKFQLDRHYSFLKKKDKTRRKAIHWDGSYTPFTNQGK
ncbi:MAG: YukJ family protein [Chloroflexi bacterium]|nr:YukJ family protein [Chloroflexota bacterium]OJW01829.1 MAG: hypothetical protein BGO39_28165 [Chloroflexi bacterium 54-19]